MFQVVEQDPHGNGTITVIASNFANGVLATPLDGGTVTGTVAVGPHADFPGAESQVTITLTIAPPA